MGEIVILSAANQQDPTNDASLKDNDRDHRGGYSINGIINVGVPAKINNYKDTYQWDARDVSGRQDYHIWCHTPHYDEYPAIKRR